MTPATTRPYETRERRLVVHLYRSFELPVTFSGESASLTPAMQRDLMRTIQQHQADFLTRISQLRHNYSNYLQLIAGSTEKVSHRGIFQQSVGWYSQHRPEYYERFKQLLLDIRNLLPCLGPSNLDMPDEEMVGRIRRFETEANAVIVHPVRDMAFKILTRTLVGEGLVTEQAMIVYFNLKDGDFTRDAFSRVIARVISNRHRLYFKKNVGDELLAANINVLQGQLDGHCSHLMSLLTSRDMSSFVRHNLRSIRNGFLPVIMGQVVKDLGDLDRHRSQIYAHTLDREKISLKDLIFDNTVISPGFLAMSLQALEPLTQPFDPDDPEHQRLDVVEGKVLAGVSRCLDFLDQFGSGVQRLPGELDLRVKWLRDQFDAGLDATLDFLGRYDGIFDKVEEAVRPLMGMISFDSGGQAEFYARWFPGLNELLQRDRLMDDYILTLTRARAAMAGQQQHEAALRRVLQDWITPHLHDHLRDDNPHVRRFVSGDLYDVLVWTWQFLRPLRDFPQWLYRLETRIYEQVEDKRNHAKMVIAAGKEPS